MLVLKRKSGESVLIGDNIYVKIITVDNNRVKLAIEAPRSVSIYRTELREAVSSNKEAANTSESTIQAFQKMLKEKKKQEP